MITYNLMKSGSDPLYISIYKSIKNDILTGNLKPGERLPSKRTLAANLGVSVVTVENSYAQLLAEGYLFSRPKQGFYVANLSELPKSTLKSDSEISGETQIGEPAATYFADFSDGRTSSDLFPFTIWSKVIREVLADNRLKLMAGSPCGGVPALRKSIAKYLRGFRDMSVNPEQIIIGAGTEYLYGLLIQLFGGKKHYAVENPGYRKPEQVYKSFHMPCSRIPMDSAGICISELEKSGADVVHISPSHQYPTGIVMPISRRYELLAWAAKKNSRYIIEDDYDSELRLSGKPIPTLQSVDLSGKVIYMNTFTKTLCSTVRISYMVLPQTLTKAFYERLSFYSCTVSNFEQYALSRFIDEGNFEKHINRMRSYYKNRRDLLLHALQASALAGKATVSGAEAGTHFLLALDTETSQKDVLSKALEKGIRLTPLSDYSPEDDTKENLYVMNYASIDVTRADEIWHRLSECCL